MPPRSSKRIAPLKAARTSDADEVARRRERARTAKYTIRNLQPAYPVFSNFEVHSDSGKIYEVEIRDLAWRQVFCTCVDFRINKLGTCKHVEAVIEQLERKEPAAYENALEGGSSRIDIIAGDAPGSLAVERGIEQLPVSMRRMVSLDGIIDASFSAAFLSACKAHEPLVRISLELREGIERQNQQLERLEVRREYEANVRRGEAPASETRVPLYPYQREGMLHLAFQERAVISDEFGLDRAAQAIGASLLLHRLNRVQRVLIITSSSLIPLWESEIKEYAGVSPLVAEGTVKQRLAHYRLGSFFTVLRFEDAMADIETINTILKPDAIILDEAQRIRDWHSPTAMRIKQLESRYGFVLTGTELGEAPDEIYSIMSFVDPTVLGPLFRFNRDYYTFDDSGRVEGMQNLERLREKVRPYLLRRSRVEVASQIPKRSERTYFVPLTRYQRELYSGHEANVHALLKAGKSRPLSDAQREHLMREMGMLRMICASPAVIGDKEKRSGKLSEVEAILRECLQQPNQKIVIFSEWERMLQLVSDVCATLRVEVAWNKGSLAGNQRRKEIEKFNNEDSCRILLSTDAVASGILLKDAGILINCDIPWSPEKLEQRIARLQCLNPLYPLSVIHLVAGNTVEQKIFDRWAKDVSRRGKQIDAKRVSRTEGATKSTLGQVAAVFDLSAEEAPVSVSRENREETTKFTTEATRKLKLAGILKKEDFTEESAHALAEAFLAAGCALATSRNLPLPTAVAQIVAEPYSKHLDRHALALWRWVKDPVQNLDAGLEAVSGLLASSDW
ncbi:MAG: DEAD/DEAH box helicase [Chthoniobacterales bacterium]